MKQPRPLIAAHEVVEALPLNRYGLGFLVPALMKWFGISAINQIYAKSEHLTGVAFLEDALKGMNIRYQIPPRQLGNLPKNGAFITVSNHPFGLLDGILLILIVGSVRPDFKVMANFMLQRLATISEFFIPVDPFEGEQQTARSLSGMKLTLEHLKKGYPTGFFPAGEVSTRQPNGKIEDRPWQQPALKLIRKAGVPIVPIYFEGQNSPTFHLLGKIHPLLRTSQLLNEFANKAGKTIHIQVRQPISVEQQQTAPDLQTFGQLLRTKTYGY